MLRKIIVVAALGLLASACSTPLAPQQQTFENVQILRSPDVPQIALGEFKLAKGLPASVDKSIGIRADNLTPPPGLTYSGYLRQTLEVELTGAGKLNPSAPVSISGELTRSEVSTSGTNSKGALGARFLVTRSGSKVFDKELTVSEEWPSAFFGVEAIPDAANHYNSFYSKLVTKLLQDQEFRAALR